jgi:hypothetical protein
MMLQPGHFGKQTRNDLEYFEMWSWSGWRRIVGSIVREMKRYYTEPKRIGIAYIQLRE